MWRSWKSIARSSSSSDGNFIGNACNRDRDDLLWIAESARWYGVTQAYVSFFFQLSTVLVDPWSIGCFVSWLLLLLFYLSFISAVWCFIRQICGKFSSATRRNKFLSIALVNHPTRSAHRQIPRNGPSSTTSTTLSPQVATFYATGYIWGSK